MWLQRPDSIPVLGLAMVAGSTDAISYVGLGEVFPANMTGNTVLLGVGAATGATAHAERSAVALGAFVIGALAGGLLSAGGLNVPGRRHRLLMAGALGELAALGSACGWLIAVGGRPGEAALLGVVALLSLAMGLQSATVTALQLGISATYLTGTWTSVSTWMAGRLAPRRAAADADQTGVPVLRAAVLVCYFAAAVLGAYVHHLAGAPAMLVPTGLVACVVVWLGALRRSPAA